MALYGLPFLCTRISKSADVLTNVISSHWICLLWIWKQILIMFHSQHCSTSMISQITLTCNAMNKIIRLINTRLCNGLCLLLAWEQLRCDMNWSKHRSNEQSASRWFIVTKHNTRCWDNLLVWNLTLHFNFFRFQQFWIILTPTLRKKSKR